MVDRCTSCRVRTLCGHTGKHHTQKHTTHGTRHDRHTHTQHTQHTGTHCARCRFFAPHGILAHGAPHPIVGASGSVLGVCTICEVPRSVRSHTPCPTPARHGTQGHPVQCGHTAQHTHRHSTRSGAGCGRSGHLAHPAPSHTRKFRTPHAYCTPFERSGCRMVQISHYTHT